MCVVNNAKVVLIKLTSENLEWLIAELRKDLDVGDAAPSTTLATASASSMEPAGCPQADGDPDFMHDLAQLTQRDGDRRWLWAPSLNAFVAKPDGKAGKPRIAPKNMFRYMPTATTTTTTANNAINNSIIWWYHYLTYLTTY